MTLRPTTLRRTPRWAGGLAGLWRIPATVASWILYAVARLGCAILLKIRQRSRRDPTRTPQWIGLSQLLRRPVAQHITHVMAPRWNCLARIGVCDHIKVDHSAELRIERPAAGWSFEIQRSDGSKHHLGPSTDGEPLRKVLAPGHYRLLARSYIYAGETRFPEVDIADHVRIEAHPLGDEDRNYAHLLETLRNRRSRLYLAMHFHSYQLLRWQTHGWLPERWLRRRYLPAAAADTGFRYGALNLGDRITLRIPQALAGAHTSLVTYNRGSFPVVWHRFEPGTHRLAPAAAHGTYLLRVAAHPRARDLARHIDLEVSGEPQHGEAQHGEPQHTAEHHVESNDSASRLAPKGP